MLSHHEASLRRMEDYFRGQEEVIALIFGGSVAKGTERPDSDLDAMVVLTPAAYARRQAAGQTVETISGYCTYPEGYFDVKYITKEFLRLAAEKGSEPTRNAFVKSRVLFSSDPEIPALVEAIPVFQERERDDKMLSFYSDLQLNYYYFWKCCALEGYMRARTASEIVYCIYRLILQENRVLFPCNRRLEETVAAQADKPEGMVEMCRRFCETLEDGLAEQIVSAYGRWTRYPHPKDFNAFLTRYAQDFEQWWMNPRPLVSEW